MDTAEQRINSYISDGFTLFDNSSDKINTAQKILISNTLESQFSLNKFIERFSKLTPRCEELIVIERIVDIDDTFTNTVQFLLDKSHIRFFTVNEIVSEFSKRFFMNEYKSHIEEISISNDKLQSIEVQRELSNISEGVRKFIDFKQGQSAIKFRKIFGEFRFILP